MALTLTAPASSENDTIVLTLTNDNDLLGENVNDFTLRRADTNAAIGSNMSLQQLSSGGRQPYRGELTVTQTEAYTGEVYVQIAQNAFRDLQTLARIPRTPLNSNQFRFRVVPAPDAPSNFAGTATFKSARLTWTSDAAETYEVRRDGGSWEDATSPLDVTGLSPETAYTFDVRVKARDFAPAGNAASITLTTPAAPPAPVISVDSAPINFTIDTPINFPIPISNNPHPVTIRGAIEELYYHWDGENLYLRGTATRTRANRRLIISATDSADPTNVVTAALTYNVRNAQPIITEIPAARIVRGVEQSIFIPIANNPSQVVVEGLLTGLDHRRATQNEQEGVEIIGRVPIDANFTTETGRFWVSTENDGGMDTWGSRDSGGLGWTLARASLPAAIRNLRASVSGTSVTLAWTAPSDGGTPLTGYEYSVDGGAWTSTLSTATGFTIQNLAVGRHTFRVRPLNGLGAGPASNAVSATIARPTRAPSGTITLSATAGDGQVSLSWNHPSDRGDPTATYRVYRGSTLITTTSGTSYTDTGRTNGTQYTYYVQAFNSAGTLNSNTASATPVSSVVAPVISNPGVRGFIFSEYSEFTTQVTLLRGTIPITWSISGVEGVTISDTGLITVPAGLSLETHTARVTASNSAGSDSFNYRIVPAHAPSGTITLSATAGDGEVCLSWNHPSDRGVPTALFYRIYRNGTLIATRSSTTYSDANVTNGTTYSYYVQNYNLMGTLNSNTVSATPQVAGLAAPRWNDYSTGVPRLAYVNPTELVTAGSGRNVYKVLLFFSDLLNVGNPRATLTLQSGTLPTGTSIARIPDNLGGEIDVLTFPRGAANPSFNTGRFEFTIRASNSQGHADKAFERILYYTSTYPAWNEPNLEYDSFDKVPDTLDLWTLIVDGSISPDPTLQRPTLYDFTNNVWLIPPDQVRIFVDATQSNWERGFDYDTVIRDNRYIDFSTMGTSGGRYLTVQLHRPNPFDNLNLRITLNY